ncbi:MAG: hypothetical protein JWQ34_3307 [Mucilaginibacter sp.]|uniref:hypothetical protein n=1 Tax=Mucilaginibacter sp. TaxID=1882438 RepID=UPI00262A1C6E|nr:hypothetical protein [Mucilaginibacter sp.]MDB5005082.1 hypothetical protein [Mucilaginibacter sp.]
MNIIDQTFIQIKKKFGGLTIVSRNKTPLIILCLTISVLLVYHSVFSHQFQLKWDDQWVITNFYTENGLTANNLYAIFTDFFHGQYSPINQLSFTLIYAAAGNSYNPVWFHTYSVIMHILNVVLVYFFIKNLLTQSKSFAPPSISTISFCTAFIMAIHPFLVEPVAWMAASKILLYSFFYLLALNVYLSYLKSRKVWHLVLIFVLFLLSFGSKEQAVTLPECLLLIDYLLKRNLKTKAPWIEKAPFFILSLVFGYVTLLSQKSSGLGLLTHDKHYPFYQNVIFGSYSLVEYFTKCLIPIKLSFMYNFPNPVGSPVPARFWIYPFILLIVFVTLRDYWKNRWILFGLAFFIIHLAVVLHIIPISRMAIVADRYAYIASIGIFFLISYYLDRAIRSVKYKNVSILVFSIYIGYLGFYTTEHARVWHDDYTLKKELFESIKQRQALQKAEKK